MSDFEVCLFSGRLGQDPEMKYTAGGKGVVNFTVAINKSKDIVEWRDCEAWEKTAEIINQYFKKGNGIIVTNSYGRTEKWTDNDGVEHKRLKMVVREFSFPGGGKKKSDQNKDDGDVPF